MCIYYVCVWLVCLAFKPHILNQRERNLPDHSHNAGRLVGRQQGIQQQMMSLTAVGVTRCLVKNIKVSLRGLDGEHRVHSLELWN